MKFHPLFLYKNEKVSTDPLGNPINAMVEIAGDHEGRFSTWTAEEITLDRRELTVNNRKILTKTLKSVLIQADKIKFEGLYHSITEIKGDDDGRWRILVVNRYGTEKE